MHDLIYLAIAGVLLVALIGWRIKQLRELHAAGASADVMREVLGPKEVQRRRFAIGGRAKKA